MSASVLSVQPTETALENTDFTTGVRTLARLARVAEQACLSTGVSLPQYRLLVAVSGEPQRASQLALRVGVTRPTLTSLVDGLERNGLLNRKPVPTDRRGIRLELTEAGSVAVAQADQALATRLAHLVTREQIGLATELGAAVGAALDREREQA